MLSMEVQKILEYRLYRSTDHVLVTWKDGTTSWARVRGLKCRDLICEFVGKALEILREHKRDVAEQNRQEREGKLLDKILEKNLEDLHSTEIRQSEAISSILGSKRPSLAEETPSPCQKSPRKNAGRYFTSPAESDAVASPARGVMPARHHPGTQQSVSWPSKGAKMPDTLDEPRIKRTAPVTANTIIVAIGESTRMEINFHFRDMHPTICIDASAATFVSFEAVAPHLYSIYLMGGGLPFFPSEDLEGETATSLESHMRSNRLFLVHKQEACVWVLYAPDRQDNLFSIAISSRFLVFRIEDDPFLDSLCTMKSFVGESTAWSQGTFRFGPGLLGDFLYKNSALPQSRGIFLLGSPRMMRHLVSFAKNRGEIVRSMEAASTVLIQSSYLDFLHQAPGFYESLRRRTRFFLESGASLEEILASGGMVTFSNEFIEESELLAVADLAAALSRRKNWEIRVRRSTYALLKRRLAAQQCAPEHLSKMKSIYRAFKDGIQEGFEGSLRDYLECRHYRTHRFFLEVSLLKVADGTVTIDEAMQIIMSA